MTTDEQLLQRAKEAMVHAYCPYSKFPVGAALLAKDGTVYKGANNENASYGGTICAERSAMCVALSTGQRDFEAIAIVTNLAEPAAPCGMCRQFLVEFGEMRVILGSSTSDQVTKTLLSDLLPCAFTPKSLKTHEKQLQAQDAFHGACQ